MRIWMRLGCGALAAAVCLSAALWLRAADEKTAAKSDASEPGKTRFFEMRTYTTHPGKLDALNKRFREDTNRLFKKHGIDLVGYWSPAEGEHAKDQLIYILAYPSHEARDQSWKDFQADPEWKKAKEASEADGPLVKEVQSVYMLPTDYSPVK
jgi:NIPSNAP